MVIQYIIVMVALIGMARIAVGRMFSFMPADCSAQVHKMVDIAPKDISSPWAKLENLNTAYTIVTPSAPSANWLPYARPGTMI